MVALQNFALKYQGLSAVSPLVQTAVGAACELSRILTA